MAQATLLLDAKATLGEGPIWDVRENVLWWIDIIERVGRAVRAIRGTQKRRVGRALRLLRRAPQRVVENFEQKLDTFK